MRTSIWMVRHAQTELIRARRYQGQTESPLTAFGLTQARALAHRLRRIPFSHAVVSPSAHARATAAIILAGRSVPIVADARWADICQGRWEGLTYQEVRARFPAEARRRFSDPLHGRAEGGESLAEVVQRVGEAWRSLALSHPGGRLLVVTHAAPIQLALCAISGMPPTEHWRWRVDLGGLTALDLYAAGPIMRVVNEVPRLAGAEPGSSEGLG
jgi:alpha-ribazole phosphatase